MYAYVRADRPEHCVVFWNSETLERRLKYVKNLVNITATADLCLLSTNSDEPGQVLYNCTITCIVFQAQSFLLVVFGCSLSQQSTLILCNAIGSPLDSVQVDMDPMFVALCSDFAVVASQETIFVWQVRIKSVHDMHKMTLIDFVLHSFKLR